MIKHTQIYVVLIKTNLGLCDDTVKVCKSGFIVTICAMGEG